MEKSPLNFGGIGALVGAGANAITGASANSSQAGNTLAQSIGSSLGFSNGVAGMADNMFQQDPAYMAASQSVNRTTEGGSGANFSTNADPASVYGDGTVGANSKFNNKNDNITRTMHNGGLNDGPQVNAGAYQNKGSVMADEKFRAMNSANATAQNFSPQTQGVASGIYGSPESMDSSILPNVDATGINSLYGGPLAT